jgi:hypothetical protein
MTRRMIPAALAAVTVSLATAAGTARGQEFGDRVTQAGVMRASAVVDAVFVDRLRAEGIVGPGDWASYLMARLGIVPIPANLNVHVSSDSARVQVSSRIDELPPEARVALGALVRMLPPETILSGDITVRQANREILLFHLETVRVNGVPLPEGLVAAAMVNVGRQYPALGKSGRSLFVQVPPDASVQFLPDSIRLIGPPDSVRHETR